MLLARLMRDKPFDPATAVLISRTFERVCTELGLSPQDAAAEVVAGKIIELVQRGVKRPTGLYFETMVAFKLRDRD